MSQCARGLRFPRSPNARDLGHPCIQVCERSRSTCYPMSQNKDMGHPASRNFMEQPHTVTPEKQASREVLERHIADVMARGVRPVEGIFGSESVTWRIDRESALFLGAGRAALLQLAHPWVAAALDQHSLVRAKPITRFHNTFRVVFTMIFGTAEQAFRAAQSLYTLHTRITGQLPEAVAGYAKGSRYEALQIPALRWVYATLIESAVMAYECVLPALSEEELAGYYSESKVLAGLFGLPAEALPADWNGFRAYVADMFASEALGVSDHARAMGRRIMTGAGSWIRIPRWYWALTAEWLPPRFRHEFGMECGNAEEASAQRAHRILPRVYAKLPTALRYVGPYQEARARQAGHAAGFVVRHSNAFWIGEARMPFEE